MTPVVHGDTYGIFKRLQHAGSIFQLALLGHSTVAFARFGARFGARARSVRGGRIPLPAETPRHGGSEVIAVKLPRLSVRGGNVFHAEFVSVWSELCLLTLKRHSEW
jgi:hypothetical protein